MTFIKACQDPAPIPPVGVKNREIFFPYFAIATRRIWVLPVSVELVVIISPPALLSLFKKMHRF